MSDHEYLTPEQLRRLEVMIAQSLRQAEKERAPNPFARVAELLSATAGATDERGVVAGSAVELRERVATLERGTLKRRAALAARCGVALYIAIVHIAIALQSVGVGSDAV